MAPPASGVTTRSAETNKININYDLINAEIIKGLVNEEFTCVIKNIVTNAVQAALNPILIELKQVRDELNKMTVLYKQNKSNTSDSKVPVLKVSGDYSSAVKKNLISAKKRECDIHQQKSPNDNIDASNSTQIIDKPGMLDQNLKNNELIDDSDTDGFIHPQNRKRRRQIIVGNMNQEDKDQFQASERKIWLYVGHVENGTTVEQLQAFFKKYYPTEKFDCEVLNNKADNRNWSFKVGAPENLRDQLYDPNNWPKNVFVKRFFFRRQTATF